MSKNLREETKLQWMTRPEQRGPDHEQLILGCLLRIADAVEKMAIRHTELMRDRDYYSREAESLRGRRDSLMRSNSALKGQITKLKKKAKP